MGLDELYVLNEEEQEQKAAIWHEVNKDYLPEWHARAREKEQRKAEQEAKKSDASQAGGSERSAPKSKRSKDEATGSQSSPAQSLKMALQRKGVKASQINT